LPWNWAITRAPACSGRLTALSPCCSNRPLSTRSDSAFAMRVRVTCYGKSVTKSLPGGWVLNRVFCNGYFYQKKRKGAFRKGAYLKKKLHKQSRTRCPSTCSAPCTWGHTRHQHSCTKLGMVPWRWASNWWMGMGCKPKKWDV